MTCIFPNMHVVTGNRKGEIFFALIFEELLLKMDDHEFVVAIAASAHAIHSREEAKNFHNQITIEENTRKEELIEPSQAGLYVRKQSRIDSFMRPTPAPSFGEGQRKKGISSWILRNFNANADAWERDQISKIRKRYEKMHTEIVAWENKKKLNEKTRMERKKIEVERRKSRNLKHYQNKIARIDHISDTARAQVEDKRKQKESIVKTKARKMRSTGKPPFKYCFCF